MKLPRFELFATCPPGLEPLLLDEVKACGWTAAKADAGGVTFAGTWPDIWRANLLLRGASRVLVRVGAFGARQLNVLHGKTAELPWAEFLKEGQPFAVEAVCRQSKIYHSGAAEERVAKAIAAATNAELSELDEAMKVLVRIVNNSVTVSVDSSGDLLHRRGFKEDVAGAPLRETMASLLLRACGYTGDEPVVDPMCGSGTFVMEAAEIARGMAPGRARKFAFENFASFRRDAYKRAKTKAAAAGSDDAPMVFGSDRSSGAIKASLANAERAGLSQACTFTEKTVSTIEPPEGPPGLVITNPPYGARLGESEELKKLYAALGQALRERFPGWRFGFITSEEKLAKATGLTFEAGPPIPHGGLKIRLYQGQIG